MSSPNASADQIAEPTENRRPGWLQKFGLWPVSSSSNREDWFKLSEPHDDDHLRLLYDKTFETMITFLDWRHKSMTLGFAVLAAAIAFDEWLLIHAPSRHWALAAPLLVASAFCVVVRIFDTRNQHILNDAYVVGGELEKALGAQNFAMMGRIPARRQLWTYHQTIRVIFGWAGVVCLGGAIASVIWSVAT